MSADNYLYLTKDGDEWVVLHRFASMENGRGTEWGRTTGTFAEAYGYAASLMEGEVVEYGLTVDPAVIRSENEPPVEVRPSKPWIGWDESEE